MNQRIPVIEVPNDKKSSQVECPGRGGIVHISQFIIPTASSRSLFVWICFAGRSGPVLQFLLQCRIDCSANAFGVFVFWFECAVIDEQRWSGLYAQEISKRTV